MIYSNRDNSDHIKAILEGIKSGEIPDYTTLKELLERTYHLLKNNSEQYPDYNLGLSVICHIADIQVRDPLLLKLLNDCVVQSRVFLYKNMFESIQEQDKGLDFTLFDEIAKEFYTLEDTDTVLTRDQKRLFDLFQAKRRVVVSAPTSFGKSRIVQEIIIHNDYKNILIVLPTIALLNETFVRFKLNSDLNQKYQLYNSLGTRGITFQKENNIFILTPEKTDLLLDQNPEIQFDFFTMDEIYKIQDGDERSKIFTHCLYRLSNIHKIDFYLIGPYFSGFSRQFLNKTGALFQLYESEIVQKDDFDLSDEQDGATYYVGGKELRKLRSPERNLRNIFKAVNGQSLIYRGKQKRSAETLAKYLTEFNERICNTELIAYIEENISPEWSLVTCLKSGIAFHHGALPKYIQTEIVETFNNGELDAIVCTSTIVEGVNTTAKNVIIYDQFKGPHELTGFDVKNIKGRAGRFLVHFIGNIFALVPLAKDENKNEISFSFYDDDALDPEDTIQIEKDDLAGENLKNRENVEALLKSLNIPLSVIKSNKFIKIHKQIALISYLRSDFFLLNEVHFSGNLPTADQLDTILSLCEEYLFNERDAESRNYTIGQLKWLTKFYVYKKPNLKELISKHTQSQNIDTKVRNAFNLVSYYFEFSIPKYLTAFEKLFNFVYGERNSGEKSINLTYLITILEFGHSEDHEIAMKEAGVPNEIIKKISNEFRDCSNLQEVRLKYALNPNLTSNLSNFERKLFNRYI